MSNNFLKKYSHMTLCSSVSWSMGCSWKFSSLQWAGVPAPSLFCTVLMFVLSATPHDHGLPTALLVAESSVFSGVPGKIMDTWWMFAR